ncbi:MAG: hypothetical protein GXP48_07460 [Acidobacteria bacterium]|nr:hypothetical protein [Acidobacteriota bacterium]
MRYKVSLALFSCLVLSAAAWAQVAGPAQLVPVVARLAGSSGSYWQTDISVSNVSTEACILEAIFLPEEHANDPDHAPSHTVSLPAGKTLKVEDVLGTWFPQVGMTKGALVFFAEDENGDATGVIAVSSRTYNAANPAATFGQGVPSITLMGEEGLTVNAVFGLGRAILPGVKQEQDLSFRTNIGVLNMSMLAIKVHVTIVGADGHPAGQKTRTVPPVSLSQWSLTSLGVSSLPGGGRVDITLDPADIPANPCGNVPEVLSETQGEFIAYSTTMDGATNDSEFHLASIDWSDQVSQCGQWPPICLGAMMLSVK